MTNLLNQSTASLISFPVRLYTDSIKADQLTHRLSVIRWKEKKLADGTKIPARAARCISLPNLTVSSVVPAILQPAIQDAVLEMQDEMIRSLMETHFTRVGVANEASAWSLNDDEISSDALATYQSTKTGNGHLSKEVLEKWFTETLVDPLTLAFAEMMKLPEQPSKEQLDRLSAVISQHRTVITSLASPRTVLNETLTKQVLKAVALSEETSVRSRLTTKLEAFLKPAEMLIEMGL